MDDDRGPGDHTGDGTGTGIGDPHADDVWVAGVPLSPAALAEVDGLRATATAMAAVQADQLRRVARLAARCAHDARAALAERPRLSDTPSEAELVHSVVTHELMAVLGISKAAAERLEDLADRLVRVLPETLAALDSGCIDLARARVLAEETRVLDPATARAVQAAVLPDLAEAASVRPWDGPSPRAWRTQVQRAVVKADIDAARRRREQAIRDRLVRAWARGDGTGVMQIVATDVDIAIADRVLTDLAHAGPAVGPDGIPLTMDQRRADAFIDLLRRVDNGADLRTVTGRVAQEIGLVLHTDTLFGDGPAKDDPGELRGLGAPAPVDPQSAAEMAQAHLAAGAGTRVLLVDRDGVLQRTLRFRHAPAGGWTRAALVGSVRSALPDLPALETDSYAPTVAIEEHVRIRQPRCAAYDCARVAARCDLDHDEPWPRGPTAEWNLCPRCRRHHELKTRSLVRTRLHRNGSVTTTTLLGVTYTTHPSPLPGHGTGEAYAP